MLLLMHESEERGKLVINGVPIDESFFVRRWAGICSNPEATFKQILSKKIASVYPDTGIIYSRKMVKEEALRKARSAAGKLGGQAKSKQKLSKPPSKKLANPDNDSDSDTVIDSNSLNNNTPVTEKPEPSEGQRIYPSPSTRGETLFGDELEIKIDLFLEAYPRKQPDKKSMITKWINGLFPDKDLMDSIIIGANNLADFVAATGDYADKPLKWIQEQGCPNE